MRTVTRTTLLIAIATLAVSTLWAGTITLGTITPVTATEGAAFPNQPLLTFTDSSAAATFNATINWGDGSIPLHGAVVPDPTGGYSILGGHSYAEEGTYTISVSLADSDGSIATGSDTASVADAALSGTGSSQLSFTPGVSGNSIVGTFTDADPAAVVSDYFAIINWGDGSTSTGTISALPTGNFSVTGTHTYSNAGDFTITATTSDAGGSSTSFSADAEVGAPVGAPVPEPSSILLLCTGALGLHGPIRRKLLPCWK